MAITHKMVLSSSAVDWQLSTNGVSLQMTVCNVC